MPAPLGHEPYPGCETGGRPAKYTQEYIEEQAIKFKEWMQKKENILFKKFALQQGYHPQRLDEFADKNEKFAEVYKFAKVWQEIKLAEGGITKEYSGDFTKFILAVHHGYSDTTQQNFNAEDLRVLNETMKHLKRARNNTEE